MKLQTCYGKRVFGYYLCVAAIVCCACSTPQKTGSTHGDDGVIEVAFVQMNDVYEIAGVDNRRAGGLARVAHYYQMIQRQYPQSMLVLAGDFLNPSLIGTMRVDGERVNGRQMVEVLNAMGVDMVAFGNHEFDLDEEDLQSRINESDFEWLATNIQRVSGDKRYRFHKGENGQKHFLPTSQVRTFRDADGTEVRIGLFSAVLDANPVSYVEYYDVDSCVAVELDHLRAVSDVIVGLTHLNMDQDSILASKFKDIDLIMGGHEHDNMFMQVGRTTIAKADANARTIYLHILRYHSKTGRAQVTSDLVAMDTTIARDPDIAALIEGWVALLDANIREVVEHPYETVYIAEKPLDGRESSIRHKQTNMGTLFTQAMLAASRHDAQAAILNSGAIRIDDQVQGEVSAVDIFRALPFGGSVIEVEMSGRLLIDILTFSEQARGSGAHVLYSGIDKAGDFWKVSGRGIEDEETYIIAMNDFLLRGYDIPFLIPDNPEIGDVHAPAEADSDDLRSDIRRAIIDYLQGL